MLRFLVLLLAAGVARDAPAAGPRRIAVYVLAEARTVVSPAGERVSAVRGPVAVKDGTARWDLESGTFPRSTASTVLLGERDGWLVDREGSVAARATPEVLASLWVPRAEGEEGPFRSSVRDVEVGSATTDRGPVFEGRPTRRYRLTATWKLQTSVPGRVSTARSRLTATVDVIPEVEEEVRSPLDGPGRLLDLPPDVREEISSALAALPGWPVSIVVETESEQSLEFPGATAPPSQGGRPLKTRVETVRTVSGLVFRPAEPADAQAFTLAEKTRVVGIERLVSSRESLR